METQSYLNVSNANSIEQLYTVGGRADYQSKKEYLIKKRASKRYHDLLKAAKKANITASQYAINNHDCTIDEYCGSEYIQSKVFQGFSPSLTDDQIKILKKINSKVSNSLPFYMKMKHVHVIIQAALYNCTNTPYSNIYYKTADMPSRRDAHESNKVKSLVCNKVGTENYFNNLYYSIGTDKYVNIVDYISKHIEFTAATITEMIRNENVTINFNEPSYKQLTDSKFTYTEIFNNVFDVDDNTSESLFKHNYLFLTAADKTYQYFNGLEVPTNFYNSINY